MVPINTSSDISTQRINIGVICKYYDMHYVTSLLPLKVDCSLSVSLVCCHQWVFP